MTEAEPRSSAFDQTEALRRHSRTIASNMRALIRPCLVDVGVLTVAATYAGSDTFTAIRSVTLTRQNAIDPDGIRLVLDSDVLALPLLAGTVTYSLRRALEEMFTDVVAADEPGLDVSEGAQGTLLWDVVTDRITIEHTRLSPCGTAETQEH